MCTSTKGTYQAYTKEQDLEHPSNGCGADNVTIANGRHGNHEKVDTLPVTKFMHVAEVGRISTVLELHFWQVQEKKTAKLTCVTFNKRA